MMQTWQDRKRYERGDRVVYDGAVWTALYPAPAGEEPGASPAWGPVTKADSFEQARRIDTRIGERA